MFVNELNELNWEVVRPKVCCRIVKTILIRHYEENREDPEPEEFLTHCSCIESS